MRNFAPLYRGTVYDDTRDQLWNLSIYLEIGKKRPFLHCVVDCDSSHYFPALFELNGDLINYYTRMDRALIRATQRVIIQNEYIFKNMIKNN
ncbi:hypothetical protein [Streptococcus suis]